MYSQTALRAHLQFARINLRCAKKALASANVARDPARQAAAMRQLNTARSYLRQAIKDTEIALYGAVRKRTPRLQPVAAYVRRNVSPLIANIQAG